MSQQWLTAVAGFLLGSGGIGAILGLLVQRRQNTMTNNAALVGLAVDGLKALSEERRVDLEDARAEIADLKKQLARRPTK